MSSRPTAAPPAPTAEPSGRRSGLAAAADLIDPHLRHHRWSVFLAGVMLVGGVWSLAMIPRALDRALETLELNRILLVAALPALAALAGAARTALLSRAGNRAAQELRSQLQAHLHDHAPAHAPGSERVPSARLVDDVDAVRDLVVRTGPRLATAVLGLLVLLVVLVTYAPWTALLVGVLTAVLALVLLIGSRPVRARQRRAEQREAHLHEVAAQLLAAGGTVRAYGLEARARTDLAKAGRSAGAARAAERRTRALVQALGVLVAAAAAAVALLSGADRILGLAAVVLAAALVHRAIDEAAALPGIGRAGARLAALLARRSGVETDPEARSLGPVRGTITLRDVVSTEPLLDGVTIGVAAGEHVALMDRDGRESAALLALLMRSWAPEQGRVLLDRTDLQEVSIPSVRAQLAVIEQEAALLSGTVRETIRAGRPEAGDDEVTRAARQAGVDDVIVMLPDGYDTALDPADPVLDEGTLRGLAIARALLRDAPVLLLDHAEADLPPPAQERVREALAVAMAGRTALVRSRDARTLMSMDRVLWIDGGEIVEAGAPAQLAEDPDSRLSAWLRENGPASA